MLRQHASKCFRSYIFVNEEQSNAKTLDAMKARTLITAMAMTALYSLCHAQADFLPTPPSLNAQTFLQNINHPVTYHTGSVNIEIPIHTIELKDIVIPVSLTYSTSGIKVEQEASTVGLGWMLNAGGVISKTIMGENDFYAENTYCNTSVCSGSPHTECNSINDITGFYGPITFDFTLSDYLTTSPSWLNFVSGCSFEEGYNALNNGIYYTSSGGKEFAPDMFNYSFGPYSGTFIFNRKREIVKEKEEEVILTPTFNSGMTDILKWEAIAPDGTIYTFEQTEQVEYRNYRACNDCWHLTRIETRGRLRSNIFIHLGAKAVSNVQEASGKRKRRYR